MLFKKNVAQSVGATGNKDTNDKEVYDKESHDKF